MQNDRQITLEQPEPPKVFADAVSIGYRTGDTEFIAVQETSFAINKSEMVCIVGPSGCGKSTVLSAIAGLIPIRDGVLEVNGHTVSGPGRDRGVVFQKASLLPWLSVEDNVAYGLRTYGVGKRQARDRAHEMLEVVGLSEFHAAFPYQLSGGMQQRTNLARALAADPEILLFDEPFASLDAQQREMLQGEVLRLWQQTSKAGLFITHQIDEAVLLGNRVIVASKGPRSNITTVVPIDLPWPRDRHTKADPRFSEYVEHIWGLLELPPE